MSAEDGEARNGLANGTVNGHVAPRIPPDFLERVPPHDLDAEVALLGGLLLAVDNGPLGEVLADGLRPEDFYRTVHGKVFRAMLSLDSRSEPVDVVTVGAELDRAGVLGDVGGREALAKMAETVVGATNVAHYAALVRDRAVSRGVIRVAADVQRAAFENEAGGPELLELAQTRMLTLSRESDRRSTRVSDLLGKALSEIDSPAAESSGIPTGLTGLNAMIGGFRKQQLVLVGGRPSMGKTALLTGFGLDAAAAGIPTALFSLEVSATDVMRNLLCQLSGVTTEAWHRATGMEPGDRGAIHDAARELQGMPLWVDDRGGLTVSQIRGSAAQLVTRRGVRLVLVDYLQKLGPPIGARHGYSNLYEETTAIAKGLKNLAKELDVPVVVACQLNRDTDKRNGNRPTLSDLRDSGAIEQEADVVLFPFRPHYYSKSPSDWGKAEIIIAKQRSGPTDTVQLRVDIRSLRFHDTPVQQLFPEAVR